tara:strand:+ start:762 stop:1031 length:270 start_codon:yes stop_codon:yes gene_type:complete
MSADDSEARCKESLARKHEMIRLMRDWARVIQDACEKAKKEARELAAQGFPTEAAGSNIVANSNHELAETVLEVCQGYENALIQLNGQN